MPPIFTTLTVKFRALWGFAKEECRDTTVDAGDGRCGWCRGRPWRGLPGHGRAGPRHPPGRATGPAAPPRSGPRRGGVAATSSLCSCDCEDPDRYVVPALLPRAIGPPARALAVAGPSAGSG